MYDKIYIINKEGDGLLCTIINGFGICGRTVT